MTPGERYELADLARRDCLSVSLFVEVAARESGKWWEDDPSIPPRFVEWAREACLLLADICNELEGDLRADAGGEEYVR